MEEARETFIKQNKEICVGIDLTDEYTQISYAHVDSDGVETVAAIPGTGSYMIPTALFKRSEVNQWFAGIDAVKHKDDEGYFLDRLLTLARNGAPVDVGEETFASAALLSLFLKRTLALLNLVSTPGNIVSLMITVDYLDNCMVEVLNNAVASLNLKCANIAFQSHMESMYFYNIYQNVDLWKHDSLVITHTGDRIKTLRMECNNNTTPIVAFIEEKEYVLPGFTEIIEEGNPDRLSTLDERLLDIAYKATDERIFSSIYLIGDGFKGNWCGGSQKYLCKKARVFQGNNLFSKGAAYASKNKLADTPISRGHVFLGNDKLKSNIGMNVEKQGENFYFALLDAGINWFEAGKECDLIINQGNKVSFVITPMTGKNPEVVDITLNDLPKRPPKTSRIHISLKMKSVSVLSVTIKDMGFGELFPSSQTEWNEVIDV